MLRNSPFEAFPKFMLFHHSNWKRRNLCYKVILLRLTVLIFFFLFQISDWTMSMESVEFSNNELWVIMEFLFLQGKPKEIHVYIMQTLDDKCLSYSTVKSVMSTSNVEILRPKMQHHLRGVNSWNRWLGSGFNFWPNNEFWPKDIQRIHCIYNSWADRYAETVNQVDAKMLECWSE